MFEKILFICAAIATVAEFVLEVWREMKARAEDAPEKERRQ